MRKEWKYVNVMIYSLGIFSLANSPATCLKKYSESIPKSPLSGPIVDSCKVEDKPIFSLFSHDIYFSSDLTAGDYLYSESWDFSTTRIYDNKFDGNKKDGLVDKICYNGGFFSSDSVCVNRDDDDANFIDFLEADKTLRMYKAEYFDLCRGYNWEKIEGKD